MAITKDIEGKPKLSDQVQRIVWLLAHFTDRAEDVVGASERARTRELKRWFYSIVLCSGAVASVIFMLVRFGHVDFLKFSNNYVLFVVATIVAVLFLQSLLQFYWQGQTPNVPVDVTLGRLSALISYASQTLEHHALHPMDQLMLRVQLAESEDVLKRGMEHASVTSEHDLPEEKEFYDALEF